MKKKTITALLIGTVAATSLAGCGSKSAATCDSAAETAPAYIEAEYPAEDAVSESSEYPANDTGSASFDYSTPDTGAESYEGYAGE